MTLIIKNIDSIKKRALQEVIALQPYLSLKAKDNHDKTTITSLINEPSIFEKY